MSSMLPLLVSFVLTSLAVSATWVWFRLWGWDKGTTLYDQWVMGFVLFSAQVIGLCVALGYLGLLGIGGVLVGHSIFLLIGYLWARKRQCQLLPALPLRFPKFSGAERLIILFIGLILVISFIVCVFSQTINYDSLWYRYTRIGYWLNHGSIALGDLSDKPPLYFYPLNGAMLITWFALPARDLLAWGHLAQWVCGVASLVATGGIARYLKFSRTGQLYAMLLLLSMPVFTSHMMSSMTDLIMAAYLISFVYLIFRSLENSKMVPLAWIALGLGLGTKVSALFWCVGLPLLVLAAILKHRPMVAWWKRSVVWGFIGLSLFMLPRAIENTIVIGHPFAKPDFIKTQVEGGGETVVVEKTALNLYSYSIQFVTPASNVWPLDYLLEPLAKLMVEPLPEEDPYTIDFNRKEVLRDFADKSSKSQTSRPYTSSSGVLPLLLMLGGVALAIHRWRAGDNNARLIVVIGVSGGLFLLVLSIVMDWYPFIFRYNLPWLPLMAIVGAYFLINLSVFQRKRENLAYLLVMLCCGNIIDVVVRDVESGMASIFPDKIQTLHSTAVTQQAFVRDIMSKPNQRLAVSGPWMFPYAGIFSDRSFQGSIDFVADASLDQVESVEAFLADQNYDSLIIAKHFVDRPAGRVHGRFHVRLNRKWPRDNFAFFWVPETVEMPRGFLTNVELRLTDEGELRYEFDYENLEEPELHLLLSNLANIARQVEITTASQRMVFELPARANQEIRVSAPSVGSFIIGQRPALIRFLPQLSPSCLHEDYTRFRIRTPNLEPLVLDAEDWREDSILSLTSGGNGGSPARPLP